MSESWQIVLWGVYLGMLPVSIACCPMVLTQLDKWPESKLHRVGVMLGIAASWPVWFVVYIGVGFHCWFQAVFRD